MLKKFNPMSSKNQGKTKTITSWICAFASCRKRTLQPLFRCDVTVKKVDSLDLLFTRSKEKFQIEGTSLKLNIYNDVLVKINNSDALNST
jgi:hypothetical protein